MDKIDVSLEYWDARFQGLPYVGIKSRSKYQVESSMQQSRSSPAGS